MLTDQDIAIVKSTVPLLEAGGSAITEHFYQRMFAHNPEVKDIFNMSNQAKGTQRVALFEAIAAYAKNIDNLDVLKQAVERIAHKHSSMFIQPEHYQIVGHHLIETLRELLPEQFTSDVEQAWTRAYQVLANVFIGREEELYSSREQAEGGWRGKRKFKVVSKTYESELVTSFVFEPVDGGPVLDYQVGQYIAVEVEAEAQENIEIRQYSLSDKPNGSTYRISVKKELGQPDGVISNYLHEQVFKGDIVELHPPAGDFCWQDKQNPVVLISAGVGVTPMQAMLEQLAALNYRHSVHYIHACQNPEQHSFKLRTAELCQDHGWLHDTFYQEYPPTNDHEHQGLVDFEQLVLPISDGDFYICGPVGFMKFAKEGLVKLGVAAERIHYEVFGPHNTF